MKEIKTQLMDVEKRVYDIDIRLAKIQKKVVKKGPYRCASFMSWLVDAGGTPIKKLSTDEILEMFEAHLMEIEDMLTKIEKELGLNKGEDSNEGI